MHLIYVLVESGNREPVVEGRYEFATVPRIGESITIGSLSKSIFRVVDVINHSTVEGDNLQPLDRIEIKAEVIK